MGLTPLVVPHSLQTEKLLIGQQIKKQQCKHSLSALPCLGSGIQLIPAMCSPTPRSLSSLEAQSSSEIGM